MKSKPGCHLGEGIAISYQKEKHAVVRPNMTLITYCMTTLLVFTENKD